MQTLFVLYHAVAIFSCLYVVIDIAARLAKRNTPYHDDLMVFKRSMEKQLELNRHKDPHTEFKTLECLRQMEYQLQQLKFALTRFDPNIHQIALHATHLANYAFFLYHRNRIDICTCSEKRTCPACKLEDKARKPDPTTSTYTDSTF